MTIASHHHHPSDGGGRPWIVVVAATGWVAVTTVAVLLATGVWSVEQVVGDEPADRGEPSQVQQPGTRPTPLPGPRTSKPAAPRPPTPRADHEGLIYAGSPLALVPRQATSRDR